MPESASIDHPYRASRPAGNLPIGLVQPLLARDQHRVKVSLHHDVGPEMVVAVSANSDAAMSYRLHLGLFTRPGAGTGVIVQTRLGPQVASVAFTENSVTGNDGRLMDARRGRSGNVLEHRAGDKHVAVRSWPSGGTFEEAVAAELQARVCLSVDHIAALGAVALQCEKSHGPRRELE